MWTNTNKQICWIFLIYIYFCFRVLVHFFVCSLLCFWEESLSIKPSSLSSSLFCNRLRRLNTRKFAFPPMVHRWPWSNRIFDLTPRRHTKKTQPVTLFATHLPGTIRSHSSNQAISSGNLIHHIKLAPECHLVHTQQIPLLTGFHYSRIYHMERQPKILTTTHHIQIPILLQQGRAHIRPVVSQ